MPGSNESYLADIVPIEEFTPPNQSGFQFIRAGDLIRDIQPPDYLIPYYLEHDTIVQIVGKPESAKSLMVLAWCCCVATGTAWQGKEIKAQPVFYICGEGHHGISRRLKAWEIEQEASLDDAPLFVSKTAARLLDDAVVGEVFQLIEHATEDKPGLIVIDTLARNFGGNENSTEDMSRFIDHVEIYLRRPFNACVVIVHHTGHADRDTGRGSTALIGGVEASYHMKRDGNIVTLDNVKMKDGERPPQVVQQIRAIEMEGLDLYGNPFTGATLVNTDYRPKQSKTHGMGKHQQNALKILEALAVEYGTDADPDDPVWIPLTRWKQDCRDIGIDRRRWPDSSNGLEERGLIELAELHARLLP